MRRAIQCQDRGCPRQAVPNSDLSARWLCQITICPRRPVPVLIAPSCRFAYCSSAGGLPKTTKGGNAIAIGYGPQLWSSRLRRGRPLRLSGATMGRCWYIAARGRNFCLSADTALPSCPLPHARWDVCPMTASMRFDSQKAVLSPHDTVGSRFADSYFIMMPATISIQSERKRAACHMYNGQIFIGILQCVRNAASAIHLF